MQLLVARTRISQSSNLVLAASLVVFAMVTAGCFRSPMMHNCPDADPNCHVSSLGKRDAGVDAVGSRGDGSFGGNGDGRVGGTGGAGGRSGGAIGGGAGVHTGGGPGGAAGGGAGVRTGGGPGGAIGGGAGVRTGGGPGGAIGGGAGVRTGGGPGGAIGGGAGVRTGGGPGGAIGGGAGVRTGGGPGGAIGGGAGVRTGGGPGGAIGGSGGSSSRACGTVEICGNGIDDDCNGATDCLDPACRNLPACIDKKKEICNNGLDDDGNGLVDCKDPACFGDSTCFVPGHEICNNGLDDDDDGLVDCNDPDCFSDPTCIVHPGTEICDNGKDDNGDGLVDCSDPQCKSFAACLSAACTAQVDFGTIASSGASVTRTVSTVGAGASYNTCAPPGGVARVASFSMAANADLKLDFSQGTGSAHVVAVYRAGVGQACDQNLIDCLRVGQDATASHTFNGLAAGNYWIVVQSFTGTTGSTTVTLSTGTTTTAEICNNGIDDDGNGAIDCADLACANAPNCHPCTADINLGAIVVGDPAKTIVVDTTTGSDRYKPSCAGNSTGKDKVVHFTVKATVGLLLDISQTGDHAYGLYSMPPAGESCDTVEGGCAYLGGEPSVEATWWPLAPGEYLLIFKPIAAGKEGRISLTVSAFADRGVEICDNGIDDDANGLTDCDDPACTNTVNCQAPLCLPDSNLGDIDIGTQKTLNVDLTSATRTFSTVCGKGDGHGRVYRLNLLKPMGLWVQCTETGEQVLQIGEEVSPLDQCNAHSIDCVDPGIQPFGCNFIIPSLQPGAYNLLVHAFTSGTEGTMNLSLTGTAETVLEICNNGIDDDGDGKVDCYDLKCAGDPSCEKLVCKPDKALGILKLDGTPTSAALQTSGAANKQAASTCVSSTGGGEAVVGFTLTAKADLTIEWAQVGNHALVVYQELNPSLPCEANTSVDCHATADAATGSYKLTGLTQGKYYLVVDADKVGSEGGVILQISGLPSP